MGNNYCCICGKDLEDNEDFEIVDEGYICCENCYTQIDDYEKNKDKWNKEIDKWIKSNPEEAK